MMDRESAHDAVKDVCDDHEVYYLNPGKMRTSERATCTRLRRQGKLIHIESDEDTDSSTDEGRTTLTDFTSGEEDSDEEAGVVRKCVCPCNKR